MPLSVPEFQTNNMKKLWIFLLLLLSVFTSSGQVSPITNLNWYHVYENINNYFQLSWDQPALPHNELLGYNIYQEDELYTFQTTNSLYYLQQGSNSSPEFLSYNNGAGFIAHVTAVYASGAESTYVQTVFVEGAWLNVGNITKSKLKIYPNPTSGLVHLDVEDLDKVIVYDFNGKKVKELVSPKQIDLSDFQKGIYYLRLFINDEIRHKKIIVE
jgi:hypothetical protein